MASVSLLAPPPPFSCAVCEQGTYADKAGPGCRACPLFTGTHYFPSGQGDLACDVLFLGEHPEKPPLIQVQRPGKERPLDHSAFQDDAGRVVRGAVDQLKTAEPSFRGLVVRYGYALRCASDTTPKKALQACQGPLRHDFELIAAARAFSGKTTPLVVVAHGTNALAALGVTGKKEDDAKNKVFNVRFAGLDLVVVFTRSLAAIAASPGTYESTRQNIAHALDIAAGQDVKPLTREGMAAGHVYPKTLEEVEKLCDFLIDYAPPGRDPATWSISFDTETNTLYPTKGVQLTAVSFAWNNGKACAIALWHHETPYDPAAAFEHVKRVIRSKRLILHNYRYDVKVCWKLGIDIPQLAWDTLLAEHILREDAKGFYGLKALTAEFFPELAGYQSKVDEIVEEEENKAISETVKESKRGKKHEVPPVLLEKLARLNLTPKFREATLQKRLDEWLASAQSKLIPEAGDEEIRRNIEDAQAVIAAKKAGEFKAGPKPKAEKKVQVDGAYALIPLDQLLFYAAVDADATRRLALLQIDRMKEEDARNADKQDKVARVMRFSIEGKKFQVIKRSKEQHPRIALTRDRIVHRARALAKIEYHGVKIDTEYLKQCRIDIEHTVAEAQRRLFEMAGMDFKPRGGKQLPKLFCDTGIGYIAPDKERAQWLADTHPDVFKYSGDRLMYRVPSKENGDNPLRFTKKGAVQMDAGFLKRVSAAYKDPFADLNLAWRKAATIRDSFLVNISRLVEFYGDGFIRPGYNIPGTATGRLSSSSGVRGIGYNGQNTPKKPIGTVNCKKLFIPDDDDHVFVNIDGAGAEIGILTAYAPDKTLIDAILAGQDTHSFFSASILNPELVADGKTGEARRAALKLAGIDDVHAWTYDDFFIGGKKQALEDKDYCARLYELRDNIKKVVFATLFGGGPKKIAEIAGIPLSFAKKVIELFFRRFPLVPDAIKHSQWCLKTFGFNETFYGRLRRFMIDNAPSGMVARAERQGFNFLIQSTNSDIVLDVLTDLDREVEALGGRLLGTVHDSVMFQFPKKYLGQLEDLVLEIGTRKVAREKPWLPVPFKWDIEVGPSYGEMQKIKEYMKGVRVDTTPTFIGHTEADVLEELRDNEPVFASKKGKK
jgi:DNA polymerase I-like protein with 3'-5' exonuclease and polymerase domains